MTKVKSKMVFVTILMVALTGSTVYAQSSTWEVEQIESGPDDGFITETGVKWFDTTWIELKNRAISLSSYYAFRGVDIPDNVTILNASLQFTAPHPFTFPAAEILDVTIYGLKTGDLTSWDPTPDLESEPFTNAFTIFDAQNMSAGIKINVTVTDQVKEIYGLSAWTDGNDMGFRVLSVFVDDHLATRYQESFDNSPLDSMKLYIEYTEANSTTTYYKGYSITISTLGTGAALTWNDGTDDEMILTTADGTDYKSVSASGYNVLAPDNVVTVGTDIYMIHLNPNSPWNSTLRKTTDRGDTWEKLGNINGNPGSAAIGDIGALAYDTDDTIYIGYGFGFDTYCKIFTISNQSLSSGFMVHDGGFNNHEVRAYWDAANDVIWFTRYGGTPGSSTRRPTIIRKYNDVWESFNWESDNRNSDVTWANGKMYWVYFDYSLTSSQWALRMLRLDNFTDLTNWTAVGGTVGGLNRYNGKFDVGTWTPSDTGYPVVSMERLLASGDTYVYQNRWDGASWDTWVYNQTGFEPNPLPDFRSPKMYYQSDGDLMMALVVVPSGGSTLIYNDWTHFQTSESAPGSTIIKSTGHSMDYIGGDMFPFTGGQTVFTVYDENGTLIGTFDTLEDAEAGIDAIDGVGQTPDEPNPPGTDWAEEGFGELTRFNTRFVLFLVGWFLIIAPIIIMVVRPWPMKVYLIFVLCIALGFALQWSIGSI